MRKHFYKFYDRFPKISRLERVTITTFTLTVYNILVGLNILFHINMRSQIVCVKQRVKQRERERSHFFVNQIF